MITRRILIALGALAILGAVAWFAVFSKLALIGAGYSAQQTCACLFVSGRTLESCKTDLEPLALKLVSIQPGSDQVTATSFGLSTATARYDKIYGCMLQD